MGGSEFFEGRCYIGCIALKIACKFGYGRTMAELHEQLIQTNTHAILEIVRHKVASLQNYEETEM